MKPHSHRIDNIDFPYILYLFYMFLLYRPLLTMVLMMLNSLSLPLSPAHSDEDIDDVIQAVTEIVRAHPARMRTVA